MSATCNRDEINSANKQQLQEWLLAALDKIDELEATIAEKKVKKSNKKYDALEILKTSSPISILEIADKMNISTKNVSSLLTYLRTDGYVIHTDQHGRKFLVE